MTALDHTHDPSLISWVAEANGHADFPIQNLPLGIFRGPGEDDSARRVGVAIGDRILDLAAIRDLLPPGHADAVTQPTLNRLFGRPAGFRATLRSVVSQLLSDPAYEERVGPALFDGAQCTLFLPADIGDYTDFYAGIHHAFAVGKLFRPDNPLLPNYKWLPIGYHGRASTVRTSGTPVRRPLGQRSVADAVPEFGPTRRFDYELELGVWLGEGNPDGEPIAIADAHRHIAGLSLLNDWSARDVQAWEYQPLGPFLAKSFHTSVSPWVVTMEALAPFRCPQPDRPAGDPAPLDYLHDERDQSTGSFAIEMSVALTSARMRERADAPVVLGRSRATDMYWTVAQLITQHSSNGCVMRPGDLLGSGTISGPGPDGCGSLLEATLGGQHPITLPTGETRTFLEDGDEVTLTASARAPGAVSIGFGKCTGRILPSTSSVLPPLEIAA